jgi:hypothetical protein
MLWRKTQDARRGRTWAVAAELARALGKGGYEVSVLPVGPSPAGIVAP